MCAMCKHDDVLYKRLEYPRILGSVRVLEPITCGY